jgi:ParB-like chromosome segregation protein Spo0J
VKLANIKPNPQNPRLIKDERFKKLVQSIKDFPEMMAKRPMVCVTDVDGKLFPLGGNMRLKALKEAGYTDIPDEWITMADEWTQEQRNEFIIKDNISFGEHDWEALKNWDTEQLEDWGLDVPITQQIEKLEDGEEILLEQAIQLKPKREYVVIMCDEENTDWDELKEALKLPTVKRGGFTKDKTNKGFIDTQRVINAKEIINALRGTK